LENGERDALVDGHPDGGCAGSFRRRRVIFTVFSMTRAISTRPVRSCPNDGLTTDRLRENTILVPVRVWADDLRGKELGVDGDVHAALLDAAALSPLKCPEFAYEGWYGRIREWNIIYCDPLLVGISLRD